MPTAFLDGNVGNNFIFIVCFLLLLSWYLLVGVVLMNSRCCLTRSWHLALLPASMHLLFNQIHIFDKSQIEYITLLTPVLLLYRRRCLACLFIYFTHFISCTSHPYMSVLCVHFSGPWGDLTVFVKLVIQQVAMKGVVRRTIFGLNFTCLREREVGGKWETAQPGTGFVCVSVCVCHFLCVYLCDLCTRGSSIMWRYLEFLLWKSER